MHDLTATLAPIADGLKEFERAFHATIGEESRLIGVIGRHVYDGGGKRMRPALLLLSHCMIDPKRPPALGAPVAIELIHTATLLHDDVVDDSDKRRGRATVNNGWGNLAAVLMGDYFFAKAFRVMVGLEDPRLLQTISQATERVSIGEMLEVQEAHNFELDEGVYNEIIANKTASLFAAAAKSGAISAGADAAMTDRFERIGERIGLAFQIADDLLDYTGDEKTTGKAIGTDLREGKITLPLIHALRDADDPVRSGILERLEDSANDRNFDEVVDFVFARGGFEYARNTARSYAQEAASLLADLPDSSYRQSLLSVLDYAVARRK